MASFSVGDLQVNLVDTPGHPDFIAEVERVLVVLDAAILVLSAVEGVQAQTRVLMKSLARLSLPTLLFVNKIDRRGARQDDLVADIRRRLAPGAIPVQTVTGPGTPAARTEPGALDQPARAGGRPRSWPSTTTPCSPGCSTTRSLRAPTWRRCWPARSPPPWPTRCSSDRR